MQRYFRLVPVFFPFLVVGFALLIVWPALGAGSPVWMGVVDGLVLAKARFFAQGFGLGNWNPYWFLGIPGQQVGSPALPWLLSLVAGLTGALDDSEALFRIWRGMVALGVVGSALVVYWLVQKLSFDNTKAQLFQVSVLKLSFGGIKAELFVGLFVALFILLIPSVLVLIPQIWWVTRDFGWPSWLLFRSFYIGDGGRTLGFVLVLLGVGQAWRLIGEWRQRGGVLLTLTVAGMLLVDSVSFIVFLLWLAALVLATVVSPRLRQEGIVSLATKLLVCSGLGMMLTAWWFTPSYVLTVLGSPSLGGRPFAMVVISLLQQVLVFFPMVLAVVAARRWLKEVSPLSLVGLMGLLVFGTLTGAALVADPDFWLDYSRFGESLDLSLALVVGGLLTRVRNREGFAAVSLSLLVLIFLVFARQGRLFAGRVELTDTAEYRVARELTRAILEICSASEESIGDLKLSFQSKAKLLSTGAPKLSFENTLDVSRTFTSEVKGVSTSEVWGCSERVFVSGSPVFWLNAWFNLLQVRGGGEMGSVNDWWPHGAYQIREGKDPELAEEWLEALGVSFVVVHGQDSAEPFHDFRYPEKFAGMESWEKVWEEAGDTIYRRTSSPGIARVGERKMVELSSPKKGDDLATLRSYTGMLGKEIEVSFLGKREVVVSGSVDAGEGIRLAMAHSPFWKVLPESGEIRVKRDPLGMLFIELPRSGPFSARLRFDPFVDIVAGAALSVVAVYVLWRRATLIERTAMFVERMVGEESEIDRTAV